MSSGAALGRLGFRGWAYSCAAHCCAGDVSRYPVHAHLPVLQERPKGDRNAGRRPSQTPAARGCKQVNGIRADPSAGLVVRPQFGHRCAATDNQRRGSVAKERVVKESQRSGLRGLSAVDTYLLHKGSIINFYYRRARSICRGLYEHDFIYYRRKD